MVVEQKITERYLKEQGFQYYADEDYYYNKDIYLKYISGDFRVQVGGTDGWWLYIPNFNIVKLEALLTILEISIN